MSNQYDEIKNLLKSSRRCLMGVSGLEESKKTLIKSGLLKEMDIKPDNLAADSEEEIELDTRTYKKISKRHIGYLEV